MTTAGIANKPDGAQPMLPSTEKTGAAGFLERLNSDQFVDAMRHAVTGVNVVTTDGPAGRFGLTVSAFSSVSAEPPLVLVCVNRRSPACAAIESNRRFCVNVLASGQRSIADTFAGWPQAGTPYDFGTARWDAAVTGAPCLVGAVANFDCCLDEQLTAGTHRIFIGRVLAAGKRPGVPLLYADRTYGRPEFNH